MEDMWEMNIPVFDHKVCIGKGIMCVWSLGKNEYVRAFYGFCDCVPVEEIN